MPSSFPFSSSASQNSRLHLITEVVQENVSSLVNVSRELSLCMHLMLVAVVVYDASPNECTSWHVYMLIAGAPIALSMDALITSTNYEIARDAGLGMWLRTDGKRFRQTQFA